MPVPGANNEITMGKIYQEVDGSGYVAHDGSEEVSLEDLSTGSAPDSINQNSTNKPDGSPPHEMSEFHGYNHNATPPNAFPATSSPTEDSWFQLGGLGGDAPEASGQNQWGHKSEQSSGFVQAFCNLGFKNITSPASGRDHISMRWTTAGSSAASSFSFSEIDYDGHSSTTFQAKCDYATQLTGGFGTGVSADNPSASSPASGTFANVSTSTYSPIWQWSVERNSNSNAGVTRIRSTHTGGTNPDWTVRAGGSGAATISGPARSIDLIATRSGGGFPGGGPVCIHVDHLVETNEGPMHIDDVVEKAPLIWSYDNTYHNNRLSRLRRVEIVEHDNLYTINNMKVTEDHILYITTPNETYKPVSINPEKTKENYGRDVDELKVGDRLMKFDGNLEDVTSINRLAGKHRTYTLKSQLDNNFYADGVLVDSEI